MKLLLENNADRNKQVYNGMTALSIAAGRNDYTATHLLLGSGAGIDTNLLDNEGKSALLFAAELNTEDIMEAILEYGTDVNMQNSIGQTALHLAAWHKRL